MLIHTSSFDEPHLCRTCPKYKILVNPHCKKFLMGLVSKTLPIELVIYSPKNFDRVSYPQCKKFLRCIKVR